VYAITGLPIDLTGSTIKMGIGYKDRPGASPLLSAVNGDGVITILATDAFSVVVPASQMANFAPDEYSVGVIIKLATGEEDQIIAAYLPVIDGVIGP
jgi:hypothetical protein